VLDKACTQPALLINDTGHFVVHHGMGQSEQAVNFAQLAAALEVDHFEAQRGDSQLLSARFEIVRNRWVAKRKGVTVFEYSAAYVWQLGADGWRMCVMAAADFYEAQRSAMLSPTQALRPQLGADFLDRMTLAFHYEYQAALMSNRKVLRDPLFARPYFVSTPEDTYAVPSFDAETMPYHSLRNLRAVGFRWHLMADWLRVLHVDYQDQADDKAPLWSVGYLLEVGAGGATVLAVLGLQDAVEHGVMA
jgi:hypothetical protein